MDHINDTTFQVSVKGLFFKDGKILMTLDDGLWEIPGGRIQVGENLLEGLKREILEETGLHCQILDNRPLIVYPGIDPIGRGRLMIFYKINLDSLDFIPSTECQDIKFYSKEEMKELKLPPQLKQLADFL
ncbi:MAG: NUDIX hydrolase [Candidatus Daviesbacteria bacterium]|nr:NUDIX hydrolase [Candidatus Daviesbacteria bacterium]